MGDKSLVYRHIQFLKFYTNIISKTVFQTPDFQTQNLGNVKFCCSWFQVLTLGSLNYMVEKFKINSFLSILFVFISVCHQHNAETSMDLLWNVTCNLAFMIHSVTWTLLLMKYVTGCQSYSYFSVNLNFI